MFIIESLNAFPRQIYTDSEVRPTSQETELHVWGSQLQGDGLTFNPMHDTYFYHVYKIGGGNPSPFGNVLTFTLLIGISVELVILVTLIVLRVRKRKYD